AVLRSRSETLGLGELASLRELLAEIREPACVRVQLAHRRVRRRGVGDLAVARVVAADHVLAVDDQLRLRRAVGLDRVEVDVAAGFEGEDDAVAVPDRLAGVGVRRALPVERRRQDALARAVRAHDADLLPSVTGPTDAVELVEDAVEPPRHALLLVLFLIVLVADTRREGDSRRFGRPGD